MAILLSQRPTISQGDVDVVAIDYSNFLDAGELLTGAVTVTELGRATIDSDGEPVYTASSDLTFANKAVSGSTLTILGKPVVAGKAAQFKVSGQQSGYVYGVRVSVGTDNSPARTKVVDILLTTK